MQRESSCLVCSRNEIIVFDIRLNQTLEEFLEYLVNEKQFIQTKMSSNGSGDKIYQCTIKLAETDEKVYTSSNVDEQVSI